MKNLKKYLITGLCSLILAGCSSSSIPYENQMIKKGKVFAPRYFNLEEAVGVNKVLISFPKKILGTKSIKKYLTPEAKYCMIHIRQKHLPRENPSKGDFKVVKRVHDNIYLTLSHIVENYGVRKVYDEGVTMAAASIKDLCARTNYLGEDPNDLEKRNPKFYEIYSLFQKEIEYDAIFRFASRTKKIRIMGAEDYETFAEAEKAYYRLKGLGAFRWITERKKSSDAIHKNREDVVLKKIASQDSSLAIVVYGSGHTWKDNIREWNFDNPDKKFSLIEISPFGL